MHENKIPQNFTLSHKKSLSITERLPAVRTGLVIDAVALLAKNPDPGSREGIYKKRRNLPVSSCGAYGTRTRDPLRDRQIF